MNDRLTLAPTGEQLERFFAIIVPKIDPLGSVLSYTTIKCALTNLIKWAKFQYSDFKLTQQDAARIKSLFKSFLRQGVVTREPIREKQWVGSVLVQILTGTLEANFPFAGVVFAQTLKDTHCNKEVLSCPTLYPAQGFHNDCALIIPLHKLARLECNRTPISAYLCCTRGYHMTSITRALDYLVTRTSWNRKAWKDLES